MNQQVGSEPQLLDMTDHFGHFGYQSVPPVCCLARPSLPKTAPSMDPRVLHPLPNPSNLSNPKLCSAPKPPTEIAFSVKGVNKNPAAPDEQQICLAHNKILDVICTDDRALICASCAIFCHKGHEFKSVKDFEREKLGYCHKLVDLTEGKKVIEKNIGGERVGQAVREEFQNSRDRLIQQLRDKFKNIMDKVKQAEQICLEKVHVKLGEEEQRMRSMLKAPANILENYRKWQTVAAYQLKTFENTHDMSEQMKILNYGRRKSTTDNIFIVQGQNMLEELKKHQAGIETKLNESLSKFVIQFDNQIEQRLTKLPQLILSRNNMGNETTFSQVSSLQQVSDYQTCSDILLQKESSQRPSLTPSNFESSHKHTTSSITVPNARSPRQSSFTFETVISQIPQTQIFTSTLKIPTSPKNNPLSPRNFLSPGKSIVTPDQRVRKIMIKLKLPDKYQKIVSAAICETSQILDLTNCGLDQNTLLSLLEAVKSNKSIRHLKLNRNRLTDQGFQKLIPSLANISILNLSQNYLGDKSMQILSNSIAHLPNLRSIILNQNRIREKMWKVKIEELKKQNMMVMI